MTTTHEHDPAREAATPDDEARRVTLARRRVASAIRVAQSRAATTVDRVSTVVGATRTGARRTAAALQAMPDSRLRWLAAGSVGLGAGFFLAGGHRLTVAAGVAPALIVGLAVAARPGPTVAPDPAAG